jgi:hypothetical protein
MDRIATCPSAVPSVHNAHPTSDMIPSRRDALLSRSAGSGRRRLPADGVFADVVTGTGPIRFLSAIAPLQKQSDFSITHAAP